MIMDDENIGEKNASEAGLSNLNLNSLPDDHGVFLFGQPMKYVFCDVVVGEDNLCGMRAGKVSSSMVQCVVATFKEACEGILTGEASIQDPKVTTGQAIFVGLAVVAM